MDREGNRTRGSRGSRERESARQGLLLNHQRARPVVHKKENDGPLYFVLTHLY